MILPMELAVRIVVMTQNLVRFRYVSFKSQLSNDNVIGDQIRLSPGQFWKDRCSRDHYARCGDANEIGFGKFYAHNKSYMLLFS